MEQQYELTSTPELLSLAAYVAEDGLVSHHWEERPLGLANFGPIISERLQKKDCEQLSDCYRSCLKAALENGIKSIAFCCISTGEFHFPNDKAAEIAVETVREFKKADRGRMEVAFNVFKDIDYEIYRELLTQN